MKILFTGDFVITDDFQGKMLIDTSIENLFKSADYRISNLEAPIINDIPAYKILKSGPHLRSSKETVLPYLEQLNINMVTLANNHILDYGEKGLKETIDFCKRNNIKYVGADKNLQEASKPRHIINEGIKISIINFAENEWASANDYSAGAAPMDLIDNVKLIQKEKKDCDLVFVIIHGGHEYYNLPSPKMQKEYRFYADNGADLLLGHHSHCLSGYEIHNNTPIYYSLGNFLFTKKSIHKDWYRGIVLEVEIFKTKKIKIKQHFVKQRERDFLVKVSTAKDFIEQFEYYSKVISNKKELQENWDRFIGTMSNTYLKYFDFTNSLKNKYVRRIFHLMGFGKSSLKQRALYLNLIRCEAHNDVLKNSLNLSLKKNIKDK